MALTLEEAIARVPGWASAVDLKASPLGGGITNNNYRIDAGGESFVLRISGENTEMLGIDRLHEYAANQAAGQLDIAPEVFFFIQPEGYLVTRFINGRPVPPEEITLPGNIRLVMEVVRRIHTMPPIPGRFDVFNVVREYTSTARRCQVQLPGNLGWLLDQLQEAETALAIHPITPCPCHNDLLNANFLSDDHLYILDWEYAGMGDPFFDLANFSDHHQLSDGQDRWMMECYLGEAADPTQLAHLKIMKILSDLREATWGFVQMGISKLDFDFQAYADEFYDRALNKIHNPHWSDYLMEVNKNV